LIAFLSWRAPPASETAPRLACSSLDSPEIARGGLEALGVIGDDTARVTVREYTTIRLTAPRIFAVV
jgi:hypothetical protein